jgi:cytochrome P450
VITVRDPARAEALLHDRHVVPGMERDGPRVVPVPAEDATPTIPEFLALWYTNGQDYSTVSAVLRRAFTARALAGFAAPCAELASRRAASLPPHGDLVREYLSPALLHGTFTILGMPAAQWPRLHRATTVLLRVFRDVLRGGGESMAPAFDLIMRYLKALTDDVLDGGPRTPFLEALRELAADAPSRWSATAVLGQVLMAGTEPMIVGAAVTCHEVWSDPELHSGLGDGSIEAGPVVEEALRRSPPFRTLFRFVREPCDCTGERLPAGTAIAIDIGAVNLARDPAPPTLRGCPASPASVLTYGRGDHYCLGAAAARMQVPIVVQRLVRDAPRLRINPHQVRISTHGFLREVHALPYSTASVVAPI